MPRHAHAYLSAKVCLLCDRAESIHAGRERFVPGVLGSGLCTRVHRSGFAPRGAVGAQDGARRLLPPRQTRS